MQGQWYKNGPASPSGTLVPGIVDLPGWATEKECLERNDTTDRCEDWESTSEMRERISKKHLTSVITYRDGRGHKIPYWEWAEVVR